MQLNKEWKPLTSATFPSYQKLLRIGEKEYTPPTSSLKISFFWHYFLQFFTIVITYAIQSLLPLHFMAKKAKRTKALVFIPERTGLHIINNGGAKHSMLLCKSTLGRSQGQSLITQVFQANLQGLRFPRSFSRLSYHFVSCCLLVAAFTIHLDKTEANAIPGNIMNLCCISISGTFLASIFGFRLLQYSHFTTFLPKAFTCIAIDRDHSRISSLRFLSCIGICTLETKVKRQLNMRRNDGTPNLMSTANMAAWLSLFKNQNCGSAVEFTLNTSSNVLSLKLILLKSLMRIPSQTFQVGCFDITKMKNQLKILPPSFSIREVETKTNNKVFKVHSEVFKTSVQTNKKNVVGYSFGRNTLNTPFFLLGYIFALALLGLSQGQPSVLFKPAMPVPSVPILQPNTPVLRLATPIVKPQAPPPKNSVSMPALPAPVPRPVVPLPTLTAPMPKPSVPIEIPKALVPKPTVPIPTPTAPVPKRTAPILSPTVSALKPAAPLPTLAASVPRPVASAPTLTAPVHNPTVPVPSPANPVPKPTFPSPIRTAPVLDKPSGSIPTPTALLSKPTFPIPTPTAPIPKPFVPVPTHAPPGPNPTDPVQTPANPLPKPTATVPTLTAPLPKPIAPPSKPAALVLAPMPTATRPTLTNPLSKPTAPVPMQSAPFSKPKIPIPLPTALLPKPTFPIPTPAAPLPKPIVPVPTTKPPGPTAIVPTLSAPLPQPTAPISPTKPTLTYALSKPTAPVPVPAAPLPKPKTTAPIIKPSVKPSKKPSKKPLARPSKKPSRKPSNKPIKKPSKEPSPRPSEEPSRTPTARPSLNPSKKHLFDCHCLFLVQAECNICNSKCIWNTSISACWPSANGGSSNYTNWNGFVELGQTHVVKAIGETRSAPKIIAEREAEMLFTATELPPPTPSPTSAPTATIAQQWGLEQLGSLEASLPNGTWPSGYPKDKSALIVPVTEYYIPKVVPDVNINFDLNASYIVQGVYIQTWYSTSISQIKIGLHDDDGYSGQQPDSQGSLVLPKMIDPAWKWYNGVAVTSGFNVERVIFIPKIAARYIQISLQGGSSTSSKDWGLRQVKIGNATRIIQETKNELSFGTAIGNISYKPPSTASIRVAAYTKTGSLLGVIAMRNATQQRPLLEQSLISTSLSPYSTEAWSATLPWQWVQGGTHLLVGTSCPNSSNLAMSILKLSNLGTWGHHTLTRTKVAIFGNSSDLAALDTASYDSSLLAKGMFNAMPLAELRWEDTSDWYLPYLVVTTSQGPKLVHSELERRQSMVDAGDIPGDEPPWQVLKEWGSCRHRVANIGMGLSRTTEGCCSSTEYSSGTSIFMGWSLSDNATGPWHWNTLGYWTSWSAAAGVGWLGMVPGDECGNTLIHELGHSQTMNHWTTVRPEIAAEYPLAGVNMPWNPWGYDTTSRRFRTWYTPSNSSIGKNDPMNGGESANKETCFPQYTAYHAQWSQNWARKAPVLLAAGMGNEVNSSGAYIYSATSQKYEELTQDTIRTSVNVDANLPIEVSVPVATLIGTIGTNVSVCQIYPALFGSAGNTFSLPSPYASNLSSVFTGASHYVKVRFNDGSSEEALIAVPITIASTELRFFSFTVAVSRQPVAVELYRYNTDSYPNLSIGSAKTLLYLRSIDLSPSLLNKALRGVVRVGRGWLGGSTKMTIGNICTYKQDCLKQAATLRWTDPQGGQFIFESVGVASSGVTPDGNIFNVRLLNEEDGLEYNVSVLASRFSGENEIIAPLLDVAPHVLQPDAIFGARFSIPYELNSKLVSGKYVIKNSSSILNIKVSHPGGAIFAIVDVSAAFKIVKATVVADLSNSKGFLSDFKFSSPSSSVYFLADDSSVGPTTPKWWGGVRDTLNIPLMSSCTDQIVTASVMAQQYSFGSYWQMSAGRSANNYDHQLYHKLDPYNSTLSQNTWLTTYRCCNFTTHPMRPLVINAFRYHDPDKGKLLGIIVLALQVTTLCLQ